MKNKEIKITKGEWLNQPCHEGIEIYVEGIAIARIPKTKENEEEAEANAKLICASPELLESVQNFLGIFDTPIARRKFGHSEFFNETIEIARKALKKATE